MDTDRDLGNFLLGTIFCADEVGGGGLTADEGGGGGGGGGGGDRGLWGVGGGALQALCKSPCSSCTVNLSILQRGLPE